MIKSVAVFCGSQAGNNPLYLKDAQALGNLLAKAGLELVYGGGGKGMMGALADAAMAAGGKVIGVIPTLLMEWEAHHSGITDLRVVENMHVRKKMIYERCDAAIVLPGGFGTLDEFFEMLTWNNLKIHQKQILLLNTDGFYLPLVAHIEQMQAAGFLYEDWKARLTLVESAEEAISVLISGTSQTQP